MYAPAVYYGTLVTMLVLTIMGFLPSIWVYNQTGSWFLNPFLRPAEWGFPNKPAVKTHSWSSALWIGVIVLQYIVTGRKMLGRGAPKSLHKIGGIVGIVICVIFYLSANWLTFVNGISGKITNNGLGPGIGLMLTVHLVMGITAIQNKNKHDHVWHMCGVFIWSCLPGTGRFTSFAVQLLLLDNTCDVWYTGGGVALGTVVCVIGLFLMRWALLRHPFVISDYWVFWVLVAGDLGLGLLDGSLLKCSDHPMLSQVPGKPFTLA